jgi:exonuclease SbcC
MSHARTVIEPAAGLTVLIGPNNCGKSAVVSALETLARDTRGDFMVRHGEKLCSVTVETDDGHTITWKRKKSTVSYEIDGREVHRDVPGDLHEHLKLPLVESARNGVDGFDIHFGQQKSPIFLLNEPESRAATFFSASSDAGRLLEIQDRHREKVRDRKRDRLACLKEISRLEEQATRLDGLDATNAELAKIEAEHQALLRDTQAVAALEAMTAKLEEFQRLIIERREESEAFGDLRFPPALHETAHVHRLINDIESCTRKASRAGEEIAASEKLEYPPELVGERDLISAIAKIIAARIGLAKPTEAAKSLAVLHDPPEMIDPSALQAQCNGITIAHGALANAVRQTKDATAALFAVERDICEWIAANPSCPICGGVVTTEALLEGGHAHA